MTLDGLLETLLTGLRRERGSIALPTLDGALKPNRRLDEDAVPLGEALPACDDAVALADGSLLVSAGACLWRLHGIALARRELWCECAGEVSALAAAADGGAYVGIAGQGVVRLDAHGRERARLEIASGQPLRCVTALAVLADGRLAIAEGSRANAPAEWARDLLERRSAGRIVIADAALGAAQTRLEDLAWPAGLCEMGDALWFSESWRHRVQALPLDGVGTVRTVLRDLPGYPGRIAPGPARDGGAWIALFALRTQLVEFVLQETAYREAMLATVDPRWWIAPSLRARGHYLEPLQGGAIKKLGMIKPWAPPRSYGLVLRVSPDGRVVDSLHSRVGGLHHGVTGVRSVGERLIVVSKGSGRVLEVRS